MLVEEREPSSEVGQHLEKEGGIELLDEFALELAVEEAGERERSGPRRSQPA